MPKIKKTINTVQVAYQRCITSAKIDMTLTDWKIFIFALTKIRWNQTGNDNVIIIPKNEIYEILELTHKRWRSKTLRIMLDHLRRNSSVHWSKNDGELWEDGNLIGSISGCRTTVNIELAEKYMPLFEDLKNSPGFLRLFPTDVFEFNSIFSLLLYQWLVTHYDFRQTDKNERKISTRELKEIFGMGKNDYIDRNNHFSRSTFIRNVKTAIDEINRGNMVHVFSFITIRVGGRVTGYEIVYKVADWPDNVPLKIEKTIIAEVEELKGYTHEVLPRAFTYQECERIWETFGKLYEDENKRLEEAKRLLCEFGEQCRLSEIKNPITHHFKYFMTILEAEVGRHVYVDARQLAETKKMSEFVITEWIFLKTVDAQLGNPTNPEEFEVRKQWYTEFLRDGYRSVKAFLDEKGCLERDF